jgi:hypothetical protein
VEDVTVATIAMAVMIAVEEAAAAAAASATTAAAADTSRVIALSRAAVEVAAIVVATIARCVIVYIASKMNHTEELLRFGKSQTYIK